MSLYERFELIDLDRDDGVKTFAAREVSSGRDVKVHLFVRPTAPIQAALLKAIDRLPESEQSHVLVRGKHEGTPYVVTDTLAGYAGLSEWVQAASHGVKPSKAALETAGAWRLPVQSVEAPVAAQPKPAPPSNLSQQFAELFPTGERPVLDTGIHPPPAPRPPAPGAQEPGEFTRIFQAPTTSGIKTPAPPPASALPPKQEPGEFTRMFQSPVTPAKVPPQPTGASDFERFFESRSPAGPMPRSPAVEQPITPQGPGNSGHNKVGEFTRMFGKVDIPAQSPPPPAAATPPKEPGEFTRMFKTPAAPPAFPPASAPQAVLPVAPKPSGPGEYTRQFAAPARLTLGQDPGPSSYTPSQGMPAPPLHAAPAPPTAKKTILPLVIGIASVVVVALLIVLFFALRPK